MHLKENMIKYLRMEEAVAYFTVLRRRRIIKMQIRNV